MQKGVFYKPLCNYLITYRLQSQFLAIILHFGNKGASYSVRLFHNFRFITDGHKKRGRHIRLPLFCTMKKVLPSLLNNAPYPVIEG